MNFEEGYRPSRFDQAGWPLYVKWLELKFEKGYLPPKDDKEQCIVYGEWCEKIFLQEMAERSFLAVKLNREKPRRPKAIDFYVNQWGYCDLKTQTSPFFMAQRDYGIDPNRAISFNVKDCLNYAPYLKKGIDVGLFFWVDWKVLSRGRLGPTNYRWGVYFMRFSEIQSIVEADQTQSHEYNDRKESGTKQWRKDHGQNNSGNADKSIGLSVDWMEPVLHSFSNPWLKA